MKYILGRKIEMTRLWQGENVVPVTKVAVGPCQIAQIKTKKNDGYDAVQLGYGERKAKNIAKPQLGHLEGLDNYRWLREFRYDFIRRPADKNEFEKLTRGDTIDASTFAVGDMVDVIGHSKGRGFQGGVKRHGFHGHNTTHGTKDQVRMPGSIGAGEPQHVFKGTRMAGRMGNEQVTVQNLEIIKVNPEDNTILIKGGLPGARNSLVLISGDGELTVNADKAPKEQGVKAEPVEAAQEKVEAQPEPAKSETKIETPVEVVAPEKKVEETKPEAAPAIKAEPKKTEEVKIEKPVEPVKAEEVKPEVKPAEPAAKVPEEKPASSASSEQTKPEVKPAATEPVGAEEKTEEKPVESVPKDPYLKMFENIQQIERDKLSSPEAMTAITALEEAYKIDLLPILAKLATKEVMPENLAAYLVTLLKMEQAKAEEIANAIKEKKLC